MTDEPRTPEQAAGHRAAQRRRYVRRRLTALGIAIAALVLVGALMAGFVVGADAPAPASERLGAATVCEPPTEPPETVRPSWLTARRQTVLVDSVLLGGTVAIREAFRGRRTEIVGEPAIMLPAMADEIAARSRRVTRLVVIGIGYNSLWERQRRNYPSWARKFDNEARDLLAALRRKGARQFVWVTLREARRAVIPPSALSQHNRYAWYFPYVNERLRRLDRRRDDLVVAPWGEVSDLGGITYDAIHLNPEGAALMARTVKQTIRAEGRRQTKVVPPPSDCG